MNKGELVSAVAAKTGLPGKEAAAAVDAFFEMISAAVVRGERVSISGFGVFAPVDRAGRVGRNPLSGAVIQVAPRTVARFTPALSFKRALNLAVPGAKRAPAAKKAAPGRRPAKATAAAPPPGRQGGGGTGW